MSTCCSRDVQQSALIARPMTRECRLVGRLLDVKLLSDLPRAGHVLQRALDHKQDWTCLHDLCAAQRYARFFIGLYCKMDCCRSVAS